MNLICWMLDGSFIRFFSSISMDSYKKKNLFVDFICRVIFLQFLIITFQLKTSNSGELEICLLFHTNLWWSLDPLVNLNLLVNIFYIPNAPSSTIQSCSHTLPHRTLELVIEESSLEENNLESLKNQNRLMLVICSNAHTNFNPLRTINSKKECNKHSWREYFKDFS